MPRRTVRVKLYLGGGSLRATIPKPIVEEARLRPGDEVVFFISDEGYVCFKRVTRLREEA